MTTPVTSVSPEMPIEDLARLLLERRISGVPVVDAEERVIGIVSEGDLLRRVGNGDAHRSWWLWLFSDPARNAAEYVKTHGRHVADVMTREVVTVCEDTRLPEIAMLLEERHIKRVPVVRDGRLVGIVSRANLLHGLAVGMEAKEAPSLDDAAIRERILETMRDEIDGMTEFINVVVADGIVDLWGATDSPEVKRAIRVAAENCPGVREVRDHIGVLSPMTRATLWAE